MTLPLDPVTRFGVMTDMPTRARVRRTTELADRLGYDSLWLGDHLSFTQPMLDPLLRLTYAAAFSDRLMFGTSVYLLPLRHPGPVAKQVATLDHMCDGRLIFGVGVGGEFPQEYALAGVPHNQRGARLSEGIEVLRKLWTGRPVAHDGRFYPFPELAMEPPPVQPGGPPIWCGGRSDAALRRAGELADGYVSYVVTPEMFAQALDTIAAAADKAGRQVDRFGTGHLLFARIDDSYEAAFAAANAELSARYGMDFTKATERYVALGRPEDVAERIHAYHDAGVRHIIYDCVSPLDQRDDQRTRFAEEVKPLLANL
jgi:probable F420-dependent oxidoreductase